MESRLTLYSVGLLLLSATELSVVLRNRVSPFRTATRTICLAILAVAVIDNASIGFSAYIVNDFVLRAFAILRVVAHAALVPWLLVSSAELVQARLLLLASYPVAIVLGVYDLWHTFVDQGIELDLRPFVGTLRYVNTNVAGPPIITILVNIVIIAAGVYIRRRLKEEGNSVLVGGIVSLIANALPIDAVGPLPGVFGEMVLCFYLLKAEAFYWRRRKGEKNE